MRTENPNSKKQYVQSELLQLSCNKGLLLCASITDMNSGDDGIGFGGGDGGNIAFSKEFDFGDIIFDEDLFK